jgi:hypothetical protein
MEVKTRKEEKEPWFPSPAFFALIGLVFWKIDSLRQIVINRI